MNFIMSLLFKLLTPESISKCIAKGISTLITKTSKKDEVVFGKVKGIIAEISKWLDLFNRLAEDNKITEDEEVIIANMIASQTPVKDIDVLLKKIEDKVS